MSDTGFLAVLLVGLFGGTHCAGMCGGIVAALSAHAAPGTRLLPLHLAYNAGRIASYAAAGALAGAVGGAGLLFDRVFPVQLGFYLFANLMLVAMGFYLLGFTRALAFAEGAGQLVWRRIQPLTRRFLPVRSARQALPLGFLWGWLPCGLVYGVLAAALASGSASRGALLLFAFGLGTLPNLLLAGLLLSRFRRLAQHRLARATSGLLIMGFGLYGLVRAASIGSSLWQGHGGHA